MCIRDRYGTTIGVVTLENVLEKIIGPVDDEFDAEEERGIVPVKSSDKSQFLVLGNTPISEVEKALGLNLDDLDVDTVAGVLMSRSGKLPAVGDRVEFEGALAEILEVKNDHAERIRFTLSSKDESGEEADADAEAGVGHPPVKPAK